MQHQKFKNPEGKRTGWLKQLRSEAAGQLSENQMQRGINRRVGSSEDKKISYCSHPEANNRLVPKDPFKCSKDSSDLKNRCPQNDTILPDMNLFPHSPITLLPSNKLDCRAAARNDEMNLSPYRPIALTPIETNLFPHSHITFKKFAFTLAEVLITLGIIGVVAALTIPALMANHRKKVVETRLAKFYSTINQAIEQSEAQNGPKEHWDEMGPTGYKEDENDNQDKSKPLALDWFNKYLEPYLNYSDVKVNSTIGKIMLYFPDGSLCIFSATSFQVYPNAKDFQEYKISDGKLQNNMEISGIKYFTFKYDSEKGVEPYPLAKWDGTKDQLLNNSSIGCKKEVTNERALCTKLIQMNGWKIPKDYPLRF